MARLRPNEFRREASTRVDQPRSRGFGRNVYEDEYEEEMAVAKKRTFSRNGADEEAPRSIKVRTATHADAKSLKDSAKQMPSVRLTFKEGEARTVRFLHEPFDRRNPWVEYYEHYVPGSGGGNGAYVPCIDDCRLDGDLRAGKRWYVNVWDRDSKQVRLLKLTGAMVENLIIKYERRGTIMDRDYSITRTGEGTDTKYHIEAEEKERFDQRNVKLIDIVTYLDQQAQSYYGGVRSLKAKSTGIDDDEDDEDIEDEDEEETPRRGKARTTRRVADEDEDDDEEESDEEEDEEGDEEDEEERPTRTRATAGKKRKAAAVEEDEDEDDDEDTDDDEDDEDEEDEAPRRKTVKTSSRTATTTKRPLGKRR